MIVRFLDKKGRCLQVATPDTPILIYMTKDEKKTLIQSEESQCLMLIDGRYSEEEQKRIVELLNTKMEPMQMKG